VRVFWLYIFFVVAGSHLIRRKSNLTRVSTISEVDAFAALPGSRSSSEDNTETETIETMMNAVNVVDTSEGVHESSQSNK
jgi:hypothetical protein